MNKFYLNSELFGNDLRQFCANNERAFFFKNLKPRILRLKGSWQQLAPKRLTDPQFTKGYDSALHRCDELLNTLKYGQEYINQLIAEGDKIAIDKWCETVGELRSICWFLKGEENYLKNRCMLAWQECINYFVHGYADEKQDSYIITAAELPRGFWYKVAEEPTVSVHAITEETSNALKGNVGGLLYRVTEKNLIDMSVHYGTHEIAKEGDKDNPFSYKIPEIERMLLWPDVNKYYSPELRISEENLFLPPEVFVQKAKEKLDKKTCACEELGLGEIILKNDLEDLFGIFYSADSDPEFREKVHSFSRTFGTHIFEARKDGTMKQMYETGRVFN